MLILLTGLSAFLALIIYLITKFFTIKEYSEKKRQKMFDWVTSNLFDKVYEPLKQSANEISEALSPRHWKGAAKDYQIDVLLFSIAKFLHYAFKNREKVGKDDFFTRSNLSNAYLSRLLNTIIKELKEIIYISDSFEGGEGDKSAVTKLYFLATCGKAKNFPEFMSLIERGETSNDNLEKEINQFKDVYSKKDYLSREDSENYTMFVAMLNGILNEDNHEQGWERAKLYTHCTLFHKLLSYEIHRMYDTWYVGYPENINLNELFYCIDRVFGIEKYKKLREEYNELCDKEWKIKVELDRTIAILEGIENE